MTATMSEQRENPAPAATTPLLDRAEAAATWQALGIPVEDWPTEAERQGWIGEFEAAARRPLAVRLRYAFIKTYKPVLDDEPYRSFATMAEYRKWCERELPSWLGYGRV
jgi:hypothetical protein